MDDDPALFDWLAKQIAREGLRDFVRIVEGNGLDSMTPWIQLGKLLLTFRDTTGTVSSFVTRLRRITQSAAVVAQKTLGETLTIDPLEPPLEDSDRKLRGCDYVLRQLKLPSCGRYIPLCIAFGAWVSNPVFYAAPVYV